jgi:hypothetical protein
MGFSGERAVSRRGGDETTVAQAARSIPLGGVESI